jgi:hypothetical protein
MNILGVTFGLIIAIIASLANHRVSKVKSALSYWEGWLAAATLRILGLIGAATLITIYLGLTQVAELSEALLALLLTVVSGLVLDMVLALRKLNSRKGVS